MRIVFEKLLGVLKPQPRIPSTVWKYVRIILFHPSKIGARSRQIDDLHQDQARLEGFVDISGSGSGSSFSEPQEAIQSAIFSLETKVPSSADAIACSS